LAGSARTGRAEVAARVIGAVVGAGAAAGPVEQGQFSAETLQNNLGGIAVLAGLVLPFACLQRTFEVNLRALLEVLLGDPAQVLVEDDDAVPFGLFPPLAACLVAPALGSGDAQVGHWPSILGAPNFRVRAQIADQDDLVDAARHGALRLLALYST